MEPSKSHHLSSQPAVQLEAGYPRTPENLGRGARGGSDLELAGFHTAELKFPRYLGFRPSRRSSSSMELSDSTVIGLRRNHWELMWV